MTLPVLNIYSRRGCHLCEILIEELLPITDGLAELNILDIDTRLSWKTKYADKIPVVEHNGKTLCQYKLNMAAINKILFN